MLPPLLQASERIGSAIAKDTRTVAELRAELKTRGLHVSGRKAQLLNRLAFHDGRLSLARRRTLTTVLVSYGAGGRADAPEALRSIFGLELWSSPAANVRLAHAIGVNVNNVMDDLLVEQGLDARYIIGGYDI